MKKYCLMIFTLLSSNFANAYYWTEAVPSHILLVDGGLLVSGPFDIKKSTCANGKGIFLENNESDAKQFDRKLSMAMMAFASGKTLKVFINDPVETNCKSISAHGIVPVVYSNYWIVK